jgi:hypothetical protein
MIGIVVVAWGFSLRSIWRFNLLSRLNTLLRRRRRDQAAEAAATPQATETEGR